MVLGNDCPGERDSVHMPLYRRSPAMTQVDSSRMLHASSDAVWQVVADPTRLAEWVPTTRLAQRADTEDVHLEGESHGHPYAVTSPFHAEPAQRRLDWSAQHVPGYAGSLQVLDRDGSAESPTTSSHHQTRSSPKSDAGPRRR
jgi:hypothetical protein